MINVVKLTISKTANGYYVEHEADKVVNAYSVKCEAGEWDSLNPSLAGNFETPFIAKGGTEETAGNTDEAKERIAKLEKQLEEAEKAKQELAALKEAAGDVDILKAIEKAKAEAAETTETAESGKNSGSSGRARQNK